MENIKEIKSRGTLKFYIMISIYSFLILVSLINYVILHSFRNINLLAVFILLVLIILKIVSYVKQIKGEQQFLIVTEFGKIKISQNVVKGIILKVLRKYKSIKHYRCEIFNKNKELILNLKVNLSLKHKSIIPELIETLKEDLKEKIDFTLGSVKAEYIDITVDHISRF